MLINTRAYIISVALVMTFSYSSANLLEKLSQTVLPLKNYKFNSSYSGPLFKNSFAGIPDTLEIFVMYVEFAEEVPEDNLSTTGTGKFNKGDDSLSTLDPPGFRKHIYYLEKHFEFARDYFEKISEGRLAISWKFFPNPVVESGEIKNPITMQNRIAAYNPVKRSDENNLVFFERKANALMSFIAETIRKADRSEPDNNNPFKVPKSINPECPA